MNFRKEHFGNIASFCAVVALALFLRWINLGHVGFAEDEDFTIYFANRNWWGENPQVWMPLHFGVAKFSMFLAGDSLFGARFLACLSGALSVGLVYLVANLFLSSGAALWAGIVMAIHPYHIYLSQSCRYSATAMFFAILFAYAVERFGEKRVWGQNVLLFLIFACCVFTFPPSAIMLFWLWDMRPGFFENVFQPGSRLKKISWLLLGGMLVFILARTLLWWSSLNGVLYPAGPVRLWAAMIFKVRVWVFILGVSAFFSWKHLSLFSRKLCVLVFGALGAFTILACFSFLSYRYLFWLLPFWVLLAASETERILTRYALPLKRSFLVFGIVVLVLNSQGLYAYYLKGGFGRQGLYNAMDYALNTRNPDEWIMVNDRLALQYLLPGRNLERIAPIQIPVDKKEFTSDTWVVLFEDYRKSLAEDQQRYLMTSCVLTKRIFSPSEFSQWNYEIYICTPRQTN